MTFWIILGIIAFVAVDMIVLGWVLKNKARRQQPGLRTLEDDDRGDTE
ncbi:MAG: hypothetical protein WA989_09945 [Henriciella sp.]